MGCKNYTVNERLKEFRSTHKDYCLVTDIIELGVDYATVKATIIDDKGNIRATGFAREVVAKSPINKYAFLENCETSAIGRCLGNFGIGIDEAVCTADELIQKLSYEEPKEKTEFEKDATAEKRATTMAVKKAIKNDTPYVEPQPKNDLETRYKNALVWLNNFEDSVWSPTPAQRDSLNKLLDDLKEENEIKKFYELKEIVDRKDKINDHIKY